VFEKNAAVRAFCTTTSTLSTSASGAVRDLERAPEDLRHLRRRHATVGAGARREAVHVGRIDEHVRADARERGIGVGSDARRGRAVRGARGDRAAAVAGHVDQRACGAVDRREGRRTSRSALDRLAVGEAQAAAVGGDAIGADVGRRGEALRACDRDQLARRRAGVDDVAVDRVARPGHHADRADDVAVLVERETARIRGEAQRRALRSDRAVARAAAHVGARDLA
jgi:hypothetical protein